MQRAPCRDNIQSASRIAYGLIGPKLIFLVQCITMQFIRRYIDSRRRVTPETMVPPATYLKFTNAECRTRGTTYIEGDVHDHQEWCAAECCRGGIHICPDDERAFEWIMHGSGSMHYVWQVEPIADADGVVRMADHGSKLKCHSIRMWNRRTIRDWIASQTGEWRCHMLGKQPNTILYIADPTFFEQDAAVTASPWSAIHIDDLDPRLADRIVHQNVTLICMIRNPGLDLQLYAIDQNPHYYSGIQNKSPIATEYIRAKHPVFVLDDCQN